MLPNFLIIGSQKAATTWLAKCLGEHPDVFMAKVKETYFFAENFQKGIKWYETQHFSDWSGQKAIGEGSVNYLSNLKPASRIRATLGDKVKLIASLRHPIDRAYSAYWMWLARGRIPLDADFHTFFCQNRYGLRSCGDYLSHLNRFLECFSFENFLILIYEEIKKDPLTAVSDCLKFLGVNSQFVPDSLNYRVNKAIDINVFHHKTWWRLRKATKSFPPYFEKLITSIGGRIFKSLPMQKSYEPLSEELRQELLSDFMPAIRQLEDLLDRDLSIWYAPSRLQTKMA